MKKVKKSDTIVALLFLVLIFFLGIMSFIKIIQDKELENMTDIEVNVFDDTINENFFQRNTFFELNGWFNGMIDKRELYGNVKLKNGYLTVVHEQADTKSDIRRVCEFKDYLDKKGIKFLYVNVPDKPETDEELLEMGVPCYTNHNADDFMAGLKSNGVNTVDIRESIREDQLDFYSLYYRTDHHWTTSAGLYTAGIVAKKLNQIYDYKIDEDIYDKSNYDFDLREKCWLGESGRKTSMSYAGLDDFTIITPRFSTDVRLKIPSRNMDIEGGFDVMLDEKCYNEKQNLYERSWHYSYLFSNDGLQIIENRNQSQGNVLIIKDSFAQVVNPFLALGVKQLTVWDVRYNEDSIRMYIEENDIDTVIVMYSQGMLGVERSQGDSLMFRFD